MVFEHLSHVITQLLMNVDPYKLRFCNFRFKHKKPWERWNARRKHQISLFKACCCLDNWITSSYERKNWLIHGLSYMMLHFHFFNIHLCTQIQWSLLLSTYFFVNFTHSSVGVVRVYGWQLLKDWLVSYLVFYGRGGKLKSYGAFLLELSSTLSQT